MDSLMNLKNMMTLATVLSFSLLAGTPALSVPTVQGDYDFDGDVDAFDFFHWQLGESPNPLSQEDLADWQSNSGTDVTPPNIIITDPGSPNAEVSLSLNLFPDDFSDLSAGGLWELVAKTTSTHGISAIVAVLNHADPWGISFGMGINASIAEPIAPGFGPVTQLLYGQDISISGLVGVGTHSFSGAVPVDPLGDSSWNNATAIASGTYGAILPSFGKFDSVSRSEAIVFRNDEFPFDVERSNGVSLAVRIAIPEPTSISMAICVIVAIGIFRIALCPQQTGEHSR